MKNVLFVALVGTLFLSGCKTTQSPTAFEFEQGLTFNKENFSYPKYAETSMRCFNISKKMNNYAAASQKDGYTGCMEARGYSLKAMPEDEIQKRDEYLDSYIDKRTYGPDKYFDKPNFNDLVFAKETKSCATVALKATHQKTEMPYTNNPGGAFASGFIEGYSNAKSQRKARDNYLVSCMLEKGYLLERVPAEEISRRIQVLRDYAASNK